MGVGKDQGPLIKEAYCRTAINYLASAGDALSGVQQFSKI